MTSASGPLEGLFQLLNKHGNTAPVEWNTEKPTRAESQWFIGKSWDHGGKKFYKAWFGDYKRSEKRHEWKSWDQASKEETDAAATHMEDLLKKEAAARLLVQMQAAVDSEFEFKKFASLGRTPYMDRKNIEELYGARIKPNEPHSPIIAVPLRDIEGTFWNFQRIYSEKLSAGDKFFYEGARIDDCFHLLQPGQGRDPFGVGKTLPAETKIYICEGFATAASVQEAFPQELVVAAFNAGNLRGVCVAIKARHPSATIIVCADNDAYTIINGKPDNIGLRKARAAAGSVGGSIRYPIFRYPQKGLTDFNDLKAADGIAAVRDQIEHPENYVKGIQPMCLAVSKNGKTQVPTEKQVCEYILDYFKDRMIRQDKSIFVYHGTHWTELDVMGVDRLKQMINVAANGLLGSRDLEAYYRFLLIHCPQVPFGTNFFQPNPYAANFQNGTAHIQGKELVFRKHDATDYLTSVLPFDYVPEGEAPAAPRLDKMLDRLFHGRDDKVEAIALAHELIGACFMPAFPIIVIFYGRPNSGKSTLIKFLVKLVSRENVCSVQLCDMHGFNMETMIGKLLNYDTDIDVNRPMNDSEVKKIIDREPRTIRRKGLRDAIAYLPAVHLFAGNALPKSLDGASQAYGKRIVLVHTDNAITEKPEDDFEQKILDDEMPGIVARGLSGLRRRLVQGSYTISGQSRERVRTMEADSDLVGQFFDEVDHGEIADDKKHRLASDPAARIERKSLWEVFNNWQTETNPRGPHLTKRAAFDRFEARGVQVVTVKGIRFFTGLGLKVSDNPIA